MNYLDDIKFIQSDVFFIIGTYKQWDSHSIEYWISDILTNGIFALSTKFNKTVKIYTNKNNVYSKKLKKTFLYQLFLPCL